MRRMGMSREASSRNFRKNTGVHGKNRITPMRGGWRL